MKEVNNHFGSIHDCRDFDW